MYSNILFAPILSFREDIFVICHKKSNLENQITT